MDVRQAFLFTLQHSLLSILCCVTAWDMIFFLFFNQELLIHYVSVEVTCLNLEYFSGRLFIIKCFVVVTGERKLHYKCRLIQRQLCTLIGWSIVFTCFLCRFSTSTCLTQLDSTLLFSITTKYRLSACLGLFWLGLQLHYFKNWVIYWLFHWWIE